ncbi:MAG TPA: endonuclease/exonuclease/phosphatase family protein, partial [Planctomycetota bacterium]|nr:endonuclease/exonuclease/phosphatase family protein [Planctomycetota bacterium]
DKDGVNAWPNRAAQNVALIRKYKPDVIGFQELQAAHWESYVTQLPEYGRECGPKVDNAEPFSYPAIFWNPDRLHLIRRGRLYLSKTPETFSSDWGSAYTRGATWVALQLNEFYEQPLLFLNTHLDNKSEAARAGQADVLIRQAGLLRKPGQPVFVTGDFNCQPGSPPHTLFQGAGYKDAWTDAGGGEDAQAGTFHNYTGQPQEIWGRIDWILYEPGKIAVKVLSCEVLRDGAPPVYPSDHFPVLATVALAPTPPAAPAGTR